MDDVKRKVLKLLDSGDYVYTIKARELAEADGLEHEDIIESIRKGKLIDQWPDPSDGTVRVWEWLGPARSGKKVYSQGKIWRDEDGKYYLIITAHKPRPRKA